MTTLDDQAPLWQRALEERRQRQEAAAARSMARSMAIEPTARELLHRVALRFDVTVGQLVSKDRPKSLCEARFAAYWLLRERGMSLPEIGRAIGGRDHTTVMAGLRRVERLREASPVLAAQLDALLMPVSKVRVRVRVESEEAASA